MNPSGSNVAFIFAPILANPKLLRVLPKIESSYCTECVGGGKWKDLGGRKEYFRKKSGEVQ